MCTYQTDRRRHRVGEQCLRTLNVLTDAASSLVVMIYRGPRGPRSTTTTSAAGLGALGTRGYPVGSFICFIHLVNWYHNRRSRLVFLSFLGPGAIGGGSTALYEGSVEGLRSLDICGALRVVWVS